TAPVIVLNMAPEAAEPSYELFFNPRVLAVSDETEKGREASVSLPGVGAEIAFDDASGTARTERLSGFVARCALREIEQMSGRFFLANLSRLKREMVLKKAGKHRPG